MALSALSHLRSDGPLPYLKGYLSFDSPCGGVKSAAAGLERAPPRVPCWREIATGVPFLERLCQGQATGRVPSYLFFGYKTGDSSAGTIALRSQLSPNVQFSLNRQLSLLGVPQSSYYHSRAQRPDPDALTRHLVIQVYGRHLLVDEVVEDGVPKPAAALELLPDETLGLHAQTDAADLPQLLTA